MNTFLLVHGAWESGWVWQSVTPLLEKAGHKVYAPSLTGLGERSHLLNKEVNLETHIQDILNLIKWERLKNITLVGHSYGGMVVSGVADKAYKQINSLIYLDAFIPKDGQSLLDLMLPDRAENIIKSAKNEGKGWKVPTKAAPLQDITSEKEINLLNTLCTPHPFASMTQKIKLLNNEQKISKKAFILASKFQPTVFTKFAEQALGLDWPVKNIDTHHFTMISKPRETADAIMKYALH